jgi:MFS family permease
VAIGWQVYAMTGRALDLGLVGLVLFLPQLLLFPVSGMAADRLPRRRLLVGVNLAFTACAALLALVTGAGGSVVAVFGVVGLIAVARAFAAPLGPSVIPLTVPPEDLVNALSWNSATWSVGSILGPALAGAVYAWSGSGALTFAWAAGLLAVATLLYQSLELRPQPVVERSGPATTVMLEGLRFIFRTPVLLAAITLDLFAVLFGGAVALLPI